MKGIKNLIFDFGGVLIDLARTRCINQFHSLGLNHVDQLLDVCHQQGLFLQHEKGLVADDTFRNYIRTESGQLQLSDSQIDAAWNSFLVTIPTYKLEALLQLRQHYMV